MEVVEVNFHSGCELQTHEREALRGQAVSVIEVTLAPRDPFKCRPGIVGDGVEAAAKGNATGSCGALGVIVGLIDVRMIVEILSCVSLV